MIFTQPQEVAYLAAASVLSLAAIGSEPVLPSNWAEHGLVVDVLCRSQSSAGRDQCFSSIPRCCGHGCCIPSARPDSWLVPRPARGVGSVRGCSKCRNLATEWLTLDDFLLADATVRRSQANLLPKASISVSKKPNGQRCAVGRRLALKCGGGRNGVRWVKALRLSYRTRFRHVRPRQLAA
jgi:hypothetical protein